MAQVETTKKRSEQRVAKGLFLDISQLAPKEAAEALRDFINNEVCAALFGEAAPGSAKVLSPEETQATRGENCDPHWSVSWPAGFTDWGIAIGCEQRESFPGGAGSLRSGVHFADPENGPFVQHKNGEWYLVTWNGQDVMFAETAKMVPAEPADSFPRDEAINAIAGFHTHTDDALDLFAAHDFDAALSPDENLRLRSLVRRVDHICGDLNDFVGYLCNRKNT